MKLRGRVQVMVIFSTSLVLIFLGLRKAEAPEEVLRGKPSLQASKTKQAPVIDGRLGDPCWRKAGKIKDFRLYYKGDEVPSAKTAVYCLYDEERLYLGFDCEEPYVDRLKATYKGHDDPVCKDDSIQVFLAPTRQTYYQFTFNTLGTKREGEGFNANWDGNWKVKVSVGKGRWTAEVAIPFSTFLTTPEIESTWGFNVLRMRRPVNEESIWALTYPGSPHQPEKFGRLSGLDIDFAQKYYADTGFLANGGFETGNLTHWLPNPYVKVSEEGARGGKYCAWLEFGRGGQWEPIVLSYNSMGLVWQRYGSCELRFSANYVEKGVPVQEIAVRVKCSDAKDKEYSFVYTLFRDKKKKKGLTSGSAWRGTTYQEFLPGIQQELGGKIKEGWKDFRVNLARAFTVSQAPIKPPSLEIKELSFFLQSNYESTGRLELDNVCLKGTGLMAKSQAKRSSTKKKTISSVDTSTLSPALLWAVKEKMRVAYVPINFSAFWNMSGEKDETVMRLSRHPLEQIKFWADSGMNVLLLSHLSPQLLKIASLEGAKYGMHSFYRLYPMSRVPIFKAEWNRRRKANQRGMKIAKKDIGKQGYYFYVGDDGEETLGVCPRNKKYWEEGFLRPALEIAEISKDYPVVGIVYDTEHMEMYGRNFTYCYCDDCWNTFLKAKGLDTPDVPVEERFLWLLTEERVKEYQKWQEDEVYKLARWVREETHKINPDFIVGDGGPHHGSWADISIAKGFSTPRVPAVVKQWTHFTGYTEALEAYKKKLSRILGHVPFYCPGIHPYSDFGRPKPWTTLWQVEEAIYKLGRNNPAYYIYTEGLGTGQFPEFTIENLQDTFRKANEVLIEEGIIEPARRPSKEKIAELQKRIDRELEVLRQGKPEYVTAEGRHYW